MKNDFWTRNDYGGNSPNEHYIPSSHNSEVMMGAMTSQITGVSIVYVQAQIKVNTKALCNRHLWGEFQWNPLTMDR